MTKDKKKLTMLFGKQGVISMGTLRNPTHPIPIMQITPVLFGRNMHQKDRSEHINKGDIKRNYLRLPLLNLSKHIFIFSQDILIL
jgi:hypothetical protein